MTTMTMTHLDFATDHDAKRAQDIVLLAKLEERLALARTSARLYEVIRSKFETGGPGTGAPTLEELDRVILQKYGHFRLVTDLIHLVGSDATVVASRANLRGHAAASVVAAAVDPSTSLVQCLEAAVLAELADCDGWQTLLDLLTEEGHERAADHVRRAADVERQHLEFVRNWLATEQERHSIARAATLPEAAFSRLAAKQPPG